MSLYYNCIVLLCRIVHALLKGVPSDDPLLQTFYHFLNLVTHGMFIEDYTTYKVWLPNCKITRLLTLTSHFFDY